MSGQPYDLHFFAAQAGGSRASAEILLPIVLDLVKPRSVLDVGCGLGAWLAVARSCGIDDVLGVDGDYVDRARLQVPRERFQAADLAAPLECGRRFDLVISLEVAEHVDASRAGTFVDNLVRHGPVVLFSAAVPGQGGVGHVNEQWPDYWTRLFAARGYARVDCLRDRIWDEAALQPWYRQNARLYADEASLASGTRLSEERRRPTALPAAVVHPDLFAHCLAECRRPKTARQLLAALGPALGADARRIVRRLVRR